MELAICAHDKLPQILGDAVINALQQEGGVCLASGDTLRQTWHYIVEQYKKAPFPLRATLIGLDEWAGLGKEDQGSCQYYMYEDLFRHLPLKPGQLHEFDA
ncbi:MAG TPA: glucosamine-6-phosphate deaminase, partial [Leclercia adecarboxylata]|nr:glucosamine-6-phosphate deaminase [Leclercia adecarboxylata]